jgi:hypothetical protein
MVGQKSTLFEGGIRTFLAVQGPGVPAGTTKSTLLSVTDVLPTLSDLAGITPNSIPHMPWDGISFTNLLLGRSSSKFAGVDVEVLGGDSSRSVANQQQQQQQQDRMVFELGPYCWNADAVPLLDTITRCDTPPNTSLGCCKCNLGLSEFAIVAFFQARSACVTMRHMYVAWFLAAVTQSVLSTASAHCCCPLLLPAAGR